MATMASRAVEGEERGGDAEEEGKGAETGRTDTNKRDKRWRVEWKRWRRISGGQDTLWETEPGLKKIYLRGGKKTASR